MKKILLVDDEEQIRIGLKHVFEQIITGFEVKWTAENGKDAMKVIKSIKPDLIVTDIRMPGMDGLKFISLLRAIHPKVPVVIISGYEDFNYVKEALKLGVNDYLLKPISRQELMNTLLKIFPRKLKEDEPSSDFVQNIHEYIISHLEKDLSLQSLSDKFHLHPAYISQLYKKHTQQNLYDFILEQRIQQAKILLGESKLKVYDIALSIGYVNATHFATVFKQHVGCTPNDYRHGKKDLEKTNELLK